jgi:hypothetical protein
MGRIRGGKRRRAFARVRRQPAGVHFAGSKLLKCTWKGTFTLTMNATNADRLANAPGPAATATTTMGVPTNTLKLPGSYMHNTAGAVDSQHDAFGTNYMQMIWQRYKVVKATMTCECVRPIGNVGKNPVMCGINICEPNAAERSFTAGTRTDNVRGDDLASLDVRRESYRLKKGLLGCGKTNIVNDSNAFRHKMSATWYARKWNKGLHYDPDSQWASTAPGTDPLPGQVTPLNSFKPADPSKLVFFQPWCCHPTGYATDAGTTTDWLYTVTYYVACKERRMQPGYVQ